MTHEFDGQKYRKASSHQKEWGKKIIAELSLNGRESILDLGCGDGVLTAILAESVPDGRVLGIDASEGMVKTAREIEMPNLCFELQDINDLNQIEEYDLIFSNATLHWVREHRKLLGNCYRALKKDGKIRFNFAGIGNCSNFNEVVCEAMKKLTFEVCFKYFQWPWYMPALEEYQSLVNSCSFNNVKVWGENCDRYFPNVEAMVNWIDQPSLVPFLREIGEENKRKEFRDLVVRNMIEKTKQSDGTCFETFRRINVYAEKR